MLKFGRIGFVGNSKVEVCHRFFLCSKSHLLFFWKMICSFFVNFQFGCRRHTCWLGRHHYFDRKVVCCIHWVNFSMSVIFRVCGIPFFPKMDFVRLSHKPICSLKLPGWISCLLLCADILQAPSRLERNMVPILNSRRYKRKDACSSLGCLSMF